MSTRYVVGGVYTQKRAGSIVYGVMTCSTKRPNGFAEGLIHTNGWSPDRVTENSRELDAWELVSEPIPSEVLRVLERSAATIETLTDRVAFLLEQIEALKPTLKPEPASELVPPASGPQKFDPALAVEAVRARRAAAG